MAHDIFLSYASEDRIKAETLASLFEDVGWTVWWDRDITGGNPWEPAILEQVGEARCVVVIWSRDSVRKDWVAREASVGVEKGTLVPVLLQPSYLPTPTKESVQAVELSVWDGQKTADLRPLLEAVKAKVGHGAIPELDDTQGQERLDRYVEKLTRVEVAQAALEYCRVSVEGLTLNRVLTEEEAGRVGEAYDRLREVLSTPGSIVSDQDMHDLLSPFLNALLPETGPE